MGIGTGWWWTDADEESFAAVYAVESESVGGTAVFAFSFKGTCSCAAAVAVIYCGLLWCTAMHCGVVWGVDCLRDMRGVNSRVIPPNDQVPLQKIILLLLLPHPEKETQAQVQRTRDESVSAMSRLLAILVIPISGVLVSGLQSIFPHHGILCLCV